MLDTPNIEQDINNLEYWIVGGAVRDDMLDKEPNDRDYVVIGSTAEEMEEKGFEKIEAQSFPVFQDSNGDEWALARTEESTGDGYHDFETFTDDVELAEDLKRRDFTINAIAYNPEKEIYDYPVALEENPGAHSIKDLKKGVIRHVTDAFGNDPVRILRMARFAARYDFQVAKQTMQKAQNNREKLEDMPGERLGAELIKAMSEANDPKVFFKILRGAKVLEIIMPHISEFTEVSAGPEKWHQEEDMWEHTMMTLEEMQKIEPNDPDLLLMALVHDIGKVKNKNADNHGKHPKEGIPLIEDLCERFKFSNDRTQKLIDASRHHMRIHSTPIKAHNHMGEKKVLDLVEKLDQEKGASLEELIKLCRADSKGRIPEQEIYEDGIRHRINVAREATEKIDAEHVTEKRGKDIDDYDGEAIGQMIIQDRIEYMKRNQAPVEKSVIEKAKDKIT